MLWRHNAEPRPRNDSWRYIRADSRFAPSQWETALLCNDVSHWLGARLESALYTKTCPGPHSSQISSNYCNTYLSQKTSFWVSVFIIQGNSTLAFFPAKSWAILLLVSVRILTKSWSGLHFDITCLKAWTKRTPFFSVDVNGSGNEMTNTFLKW